MAPRRVAGLLILGALLRLAAMPLGGTSDVDAWRVWTALAARDVAATYGAGPGETTTFSYPPIAALEFAATGRAARALDPSGQTPRVFNVLIKLPGACAEWALCVVLLLWGTRRFGAEAAQWAALSVWLSPALLIVGPILGYLDSPAAVPGVLALCAVAAGWPAAAGALAVIAAMTKPQAVLLLPAIAIMTLHRPARDRVITLVSAATTGALALSPFALRGTLANIVPSMAVNIPDMASGQAANVWWVLTWWVQRSTGDVVGWMSSVDLASSGYPAVNAIGLGLAGLALIGGIWRSRRVASLADASLLAAWCVHAYATLSVSVHENHLALAVPFLLVAAGIRREWRALASAVSLIVTANVGLFYGLGENGWRSAPGHPDLVMPVLGGALCLLCVWSASALPRAMQALLAGAVAIAAVLGVARGVPLSLHGIRMAAGIDATVVLSLVNILVFAWHTRTLWRMTAVDSASIDR